MKYRGKYSLKENLFRGRGMGLLTENDKLTYRVDDQTGEYYVIAPDGNEIGPYPDKKAAASAYSARLGSHSEGKVAAHLNAKGFVVDAIGGSGNADVQGKGPDGKPIRIEVGTPDKVKQLGAFDPATGTFKDLGDAHKKKMQDAIHGVVGDSFQLGSENNTLQPADLAAIWKESGDDIIVLDNEDGTFKALALTPEGQAALKAAGLSVPVISAEHCGSSFVGSGGGGGARGGLPTFGAGKHIKTGKMTSI